MPKLVRIDLSRREEIYRQLAEFVRELPARLPVTAVYLHGSFASGDIHEGSDIDLVIVGDFKERFFQRIGKILELTDLPIEPLVYSEEEFAAMQAQGNAFILSVVKRGKKLL